MCSLINTGPTFQQVIESDIVMKMYYNYTIDGVDNFDHQVRLKAFVIQKALDTYINRMSYLKVGDK